MADEPSTPSPSSRAGASTSGNGASAAENDHGRFTKALRLGLPARKRTSQAPPADQPPPSEVDADRSPSDAEKSPSSLYHRLTAFETVLVAGGLTLFVLLLYSMWGFISPPLLALAGGLLLWPLREHHSVRALMVSGGFLLLLWLLAEMSAILIPFGGVYVLAYLFDPFVSYLRERFDISRRLSALILSTLVTGMLVLFIVLLVPRLAGQIEVLVQRLLTTIGDLRTWVTTTPLLNDLESAGILSREELVEQINALLQDQSGRVASGLPVIIQGLADSLDSFLGAVTIIAILPVVFFYTLKDYPFITRRLIELFPTHGGQRDYLINASHIVGNYLRGQLLVCAIAGFNVSFFLSPLVFDVPLWLLIGLLAGIANLIPNLGAILTNILAVTITIVFSGGAWLSDTIAVLAVLTGQGLLEQSILTPNIMSHQVGLHPVLVILSLLVFGYFMGIFGLLIAVPATAVIMTIYKTYRQRLTLDLSSFGMPASDPDVQRSEP